MLRLQVSGLFLCSLLGALLLSHAALAVPVTISANQAAAPPRTDPGTGICGTAVHVVDPEVGYPFKNIDDAIAVLGMQPGQGNVDGKATRVYQAINLRNANLGARGDFEGVGSGQDFFPFSASQQAQPPGNDRNVALRLRGYLNVAEAGVVTFATNAYFASRFSIAGTFISETQEQLSSRVTRQVLFSAPGLYPIEVTFYNNGSAAVLEWSSALGAQTEGTPPRLDTFLYKLIPTAQMYSAIGGTGPCTECTTKNNCPSASTCSDGLCQPCVTDKNCGSTCSPCAGDKPVCNGMMCVQCTSDANCPSGQSCDTTNNVCVTRCGPGGTCPAGQTCDASGICRAGENQYVGGLISCSATPGTPQSTSRGCAGGLCLLFGLFALGLVYRSSRTAGRRARRRMGAGTLGPVGLALFFSALSGSAQAQQQQPISVNAQTFHPALGPENIITVEGTRTPGKWAFLADGLIEFSYRPLRYINSLTHETLANTVTSMTTLHLMAGLSFGSRVQLGLDVPLVLFQGFDSRTPTTDVPTAPGSFGVGDVRLAGKVRLYRDNSEGGFGVAFVPQVTFPSGNGHDLRGNDAYVFEPRLSIDYKTEGGIIVALNGGFIGRTSDQQTRNFLITHQISYGLGALFPVGEGFALLAELFGSTAVARADGGTLYSPLELLGGARWVHSSGLNLNLGGGIGLTNAAGTGEFRLYASIGYLPIGRRHVQPPPPQEPAIPLEVTKVGSGAGIVTSEPPGILCGQDCTAEYNQGTEVMLYAKPDPMSMFIGWSGPCSGTEGCLVSLHMATHVTAEFAHHSEPRAQITVVKAGTGTGIVTAEPVGIVCGMHCSASYAVDQEIRLRAVPDPGMRFIGWSGPCSGTGECAVAVQDHLTITATFNTIDLEVTKERIDLKGKKVFFESGKANIDPNSDYLLDDIAEILRQHPDMHLSIDGHTDNVPFRGPGGNVQLSKDRAEAVRLYLVERGKIVPDRLISQGYGPTRPVADNDTPDGRAQNRRTEFLIIEK